MARYVTLISFTDQGIKTIKDWDKRMAATRERLVARAPSSSMCTSRSASTTRSRSRKRRTTRSRCVLQVTRASRATRTS